MPTAVSPVSSGGLAHGHDLRGYQAGCCLLEPADPIRPTLRRGERRRALVRPRAMEQTTLHPRAYWRCDCWVVMSLEGAVRSRRASRADLATERMRNTRADRLWRRDRYVDAAASCSTSRGSLPEQTQRSCVTSIRLRMPNAGAIRASSRLTERDCRRRTTTRTAAFRLERITPTNSLRSSLRQRWWSGPETCESWRTKGPPS